MPEKVTDFTEITTPSTLDVMPLIDVDSTGEKRRKITIANLTTAVARTGGGGGSTSAWEVASTGSGASVAALTVPLSTGYRGYKVEVYLEAATNNQTVNMLASPSSSTGFDSGNNYDWANDWRYTGGGVGNAGANSGAFIRHGNDGGSNASNEGVWIDIDVLGAASTTMQTSFIGMASGFDDNNVLFQARHGSRYLVATGVTGLQFAWTSGNISVYHYSVTGKP